MELYSYFFYAASLMMSVAIGYLICLRVNRKEHDSLQKKLVDACSDNDWTNKKYQHLREKYQHKLDMINDLNLECSNLRRANEEIYEMGIRDGKQQGKIDYIKELGKAMITDSAVLNDGNIVKHNIEPVPNQIVNIK